MQYCDWLIKIQAFLFVINVLLSSLEQNGAAAGRSTVKKYCDKFGPNNTMCRYAKEKGCWKSRQKRIKRNVIKQIVYEHNRARWWVANGYEPTQPPASNMNELVWDPVLAKMAQIWANQCKTGEDENRLTLEFPTSVGQSVFVDESDDPRRMNFKYIIRTHWYVQEMKQYEPERTQNLLKLSSATEHYTQVVWGQTTSVGCGFAQFKKHSLYYNVYVCNYGPGGNIPSEPVYSIGNPATECEFGTTPSTSYSGLCAPF